MNFAHFAGFQAIYSGDKENRNCLIGIYHSNSWPASKERLVASFKENGVRRIVVATSALSMGINFPDIRYVSYRKWGELEGMVCNPTL